MGEGSLEDLLQGGVMSSSLDMSNSSSSLSPEGRHTNTGSEPDGEEGRTGQPGMKKKEKNREAARKSRKKQTERADQLHQELESLEGSNSALRKEIQSLRKEAVLYAAVLSRHRPFCCLHGPGPGSADPPPAPCPTPAQASTSAPPPAASSASRGGRSPLTPAASPPGPSLAVALTPHSLFQGPPCPPPPAPCPGSAPRTRLDPAVDPGPSYSYHPDTNPGLLLSRLTVPSPPAGPQASPGAPPSPLGGASTDLSFLELLEDNDWILQQGDADPAPPEQ